MKQQTQPKKPGRNEPCWCGSGRKYKDCHLAQEEAHRSEQLRLRQAQDTLLPRVVEAAQSVPEELPPALDRFWEGKYSVEQLGDLDTLEDRGSERFLIWFAFDYVNEEGQTLTARLLNASETGNFPLETAERTLLERWQSVRLRPYVIDELRKGKGFSARDLLDGQVRDVADTHASKRLEVGEVIVGHLVPVDTPLDSAEPVYYLAGAAAHLTADTAEKLVEYAELHLADLRRTQPEASWDDLIRTRSELLNHFVSALPVEHNPTALDEIILQGRTTLQLTGESLAALLGRDQKPE
jgi:hypothetical protein